MKLEVYDEAGLILDGEFENISEAIDIIRDYKWMKGKVVDVIDVENNKTSEVKI